VSPVPGRVLDRTQNTHAQRGIWPDYGGTLARQSVVADESLFAL
jgi:hypothetical protein